MTGPENVSAASKRPLPKMTWIHGEVSLKVYSVRGQAKASALARDLAQEDRPLWCRTPAVTVWSEETAKTLLKAAD
jgi:hypothetical protein